MAITYLVRETGNDAEVRMLEDDGRRAVVEVDGQRVVLQLDTLPGGAIGVDSGGRRRVFRTFVDGQGRHLCSEGVERTFSVQSERDLWLRGSGGDNEADGGRVLASMPGRVVGVPVSVGDDVEVGAVVAILEAMKMENDVKAAAAGRVAEILVSAGDAVETGALLVRIVPTG